MYDFLQQQKSHQLNKVFENLICLLQAACIVGSVKKISMHGIKNAIKSNDFFLFFERKKEIKMYVDDVMIKQIIYFYISQLVLRHIENFSQQLSREQRTSSNEEREPRIFSIPLHKMNIDFDPKLIQSTVQTKNDSYELVIKYMRTNFSTLHAQRHQSL